MNKRTVIPGTHQDGTEVLSSVGETLNLLLNKRFRLGDSAKDLDYWEVFTVIGWLENEQGVRQVYVTEATLIDDEWDETEVVYNTLSDAISKWLSFVEFYSNLEPKEEWANYDEGWIGDFDTPEEEEWARNNQ